MLDGIGDMNQPDQGAYRKQHHHDVFLEASLTVLHLTLTYDTDLREDQGAAKHERDTVSISFTNV